MEWLTKILTERLLSKGMEITSIPAFMRNLANSIAANRYMTLQDLNSHLKLLGWDDFELDDYTFHLIKAILESDPNASVNSLMKQIPIKDKKHE